MHVAVVDRAIERQHLFLYHAPRVRVRHGPHGQAIHAPVEHSCSTQGRFLVGLRVVGAHVTGLSLGIMGVLASDMGSTGLDGQPF